MSNEEFNGVAALVIVAFILGLVIGYLRPGFI